MAAANSRANSSAILSPRAVFPGAKLLGEHDMWRRLTAALGVVIGAWA